jgi:serine/threonine-protein kinase RsbT
MTPPLTRETVIKCETDIVLARRTVREAAIGVGFGVTDTTRIVTAASELARNIFKYAGEGRMTLCSLDRAGRTGLELRFIDQGPGIPDLARAMESGYSSSGGLGMGLPGAKRLMDEMEIESAVGSGTTVTLRKWRAG